MTIARQCATGWSGVGDPLHEAVSPVRGWRQPYPAVRTAVFSPYAVDLDDVERERRKPSVGERFLASASVP